jgi:hypothetical protein
MIVGTSVAVLSGADCDENSRIFRSAADCELLVIKNSEINIFFAAYIGKVSYSFCKSADVGKSARFHPVLQLQIPHFRQITVKYFSMCRACNLTAFTQSHWSSVLILCFLS